MQINPGILICGHGSQKAIAASQFARLAGRLAARFNEIPLEYGHLEFSHPTICEGLDKLVACGCNQIIAIPAMLFTGKHITRDIPRILTDYAREHEGLKIHFGRELGLNDNMLQAAGERIFEALDDNDTDLKINDTLLIVVGRGVSDLYTDGEIAKITWMLWQGLGFGWAECCYCAGVCPGVEECLTMVGKLGFKRIVVFPYLLFTGILADRIYQITDNFAAKYDDMEFIKAPYLSSHPRIIDIFVERINEIMKGKITS